MSFAVSAAWITAGIAAVSAGAEMYSQKKQSDYQDEVAQYNQKVANQEAKEMDDKAASDAEKDSEHNRQLLAKQEAIMAAGGMDSTKGSALDILSQTASLGRKESMNVLNNDENQANNMRQQAQMIGYKNNAQQSNLPWAMAGSALSGASQVSNIWSNYALYKNKTFQPNKNKSII
jgi:hypothetical protein